MRIVPGFVGILTETTQDYFFAVDQKTWRGLDQKGTVSACPHCLASNLWSPHRTAGHQKWCCRHHMSRRHQLSHNDLHVHVYKVKIITVRCSMQSSTGSGTKIWLDKGRGWNQCLQMIWLCVRSEEQHFAANHCWYVRAGISKSE